MLNDVQDSANLHASPCAARKLGHPAPAGELYIGSYHRACRAAADALTADGGTVLIFSDLYGLVSVSTSVGPTAPGVSGPAMYEVDLAPSRMNSLEDEVCTAVV
ncbi:DUF6884 domain-containing protein [Streptomyces afghaniensis]|uniref:DUF6884 domain-containing protein n=1 Tax=Streptomyces afghaniensis TaxID=66865 RepID=UPI0027871F5D|nr:DUF6884 domain-containing protein [Streptomyces afghaniensis]MDQ1018868.1 hypothetical protein [Streptomyces afghaniensis]